MTHPRFKETTMAVRRGVSPSGANACSMNLGEVIIAAHTRPANRCSRGMNPNRYLVVKGTVPSAARSSPDAVRARSNRC
jgi:hypothetical protein